MIETEVMLLKCYDSDEHRARFTAHTHWMIRPVRLDAPARESIEVRTLLFFPPGT
jgi:hypothetical protein